MQLLIVMNVRPQVLLGLAVVLALALLAITPLAASFHDSMSESGLCNLSSCNVKQKLAIHKNMTVKKNQNASFI